MYVSVTVRLDQGDVFDQTIAEAATAILEALNGDPTKDTCQLSVTPITATVGPENPPSPPEVQPQMGIPS